MKQLRVFFPAFELSGHISRLCFLLEESQNMGAGGYGGEDDAGSDRQ
jgi:hypothetical protein